MKAVRIAPDAVVLLAVAAGLGAATSAVASHLKTPFDPDFEREAASFGIEPDMMRAITRTENASFDPAAVSPPNRDGSRDYGLTQINERTAAAFAVDTTDLLTPAVAIHTQARLLSALRSELGSVFNPYTWIASYNAGSPAVRARGIVNPDYVAKVLYHWQLYAIGKAFS